MALLSFLAVAWHFVIWCEGKVRYCFGAGRASALALGFAVVCYGRPWNIHALGCLAKTFMSNGNGLLDNLGSIFTVIFWSIAFQIWLFFKLAKNIGLENSEYEWKKIPDFPSMEAITSLGKSKETVAVLIFKFLTIGVRNYSSKSKLYASIPHLIALLTMNMLSKMSRKLDCKNALRLL